MDKATRKEYAKLYAQRKEIEGKLDALKLEIIDEMQEAGVTKQDTDYGTFTVAARKDYKYSKKVNNLVEKVKLAKIKEEESGVAKAVITEYLRFTI